MLKSKALAGIFMLSGLLAGHAPAAEDAGGLPLEEIEITVANQSGRLF